MKLAPYSTQNIRPSHFSHVRCTVRTQRTCAENALPPAMATPARRETDAIAILYSTVSADVLGRRLYCCVFGVGGYFVCMQCPWILSLCSMEDSRAQCVASMPSGPATHEVIIITLPSARATYSETTPAPAARKPRVCVGLRSFFLMFISPPSRYAITKFCTPAKVRGPVLPPGVCDFTAVPRYLVELGGGLTGRNVQCSNGGEGHGSCIPIRMPLRSAFRVA